MNGSRKFLSGRPGAFLVLLGCLALLASPVRADDDDAPPPMKRPPRGQRARVPSPSGPAGTVPPGIRTTPGMVAPPGMPPPGMLGTAAAAGSPGPGSTQELPLPGEREFAECKRIPANKRVVVSLKPDSELADLIGWIKTISCRPFIIPNSIRQSKVTVIVPEAITAGEAYRIFLSALESMGLTVQPDGKVLKIIESNRARESSIPVISPGNEPPLTEQYVTKMLRLNHVYPDEIVQVLNRLKGRDGDITPYAPTNMLVITDLASNIRRMEEVVRSLDVPMGGEKIWIIRLRNVAAGEVAQMLQQVLGVGKGGGSGSAGAQGQARRPPVSVTPPTSGTDVATTAPSSEGGGGNLSISQIVPDDRTNTLILVATERAYQQVLALIKRLETQGGEGGGDRVHVYALENANAEDLAAVLQGLGVSVSAGGGRRSGSSPGRGGNAPAPVASGGQGGGSAGLFQEEVKVTADKSTNSLVILAGGKDFLTLKDVIRRLDIPRRQVFIEATVMEVNISKQLDLGLSYHGGLPVGNGDSQTLILGGLSGGPNKLSSLNPLGIAALSGLAAGAIGPLFSGTTVLGQAGQSIPSFGVLLQALQTNTDVNTLQVPNILTTDNEKATIQVGQNLPFKVGGFGLPGIGGGAAGGGGLGALAIGSNFQRQDVALKLEITPHVNASDFVRLEIDNEISDVAGTDPEGGGPITNKRVIKTVAVVRDQQPVVLGGILKDSINESVSKIPLLGDIPILGYLFKIKRRATQKQMLIVVLTPYVINDPSDLRRVFERKMKERREFIETYSVFRNEQDFDKVVDYSRKRGALEEINRTATEAEREAAELQAAQLGMRHEIEAGPVELPLPPMHGGKSEAPAPAATPSAPPSVSPGMPATAPPATTLPSRTVPNR